jgi:hypothetical protein
MMALEAAVAPRSTSPEHSGRASPIPRRWASQQGEGAHSFVPVGPEY